MRTFVVFLFILVSFEAFSENPIPKAAKTECGSEVCRQLSVAIDEIDEQKAIGLLDDLLTDLTFPQGHAAPVKLVKFSQDPKEKEIEMKLLVEQVSRVTRGDSLGRVQQYLAALQKMESELFDKNVKNLKTEEKREEIKKSLKESQALQSSSNPSDRDARPPKDSAVEGAR